MHLRVCQSVGGSSLDFREIPPHNVIPANCHVPLTLPKSRKARQLTGWHLWASPTLAQLAATGIALCVLICAAEHGDKATLENKVGQRARRLTSACARVINHCGRREQTSCTIQIKGIADDLRCFCKETLRTDCSTDNIKQFNKTGELFIHSVIFIECVVTLSWFLLYTWHLLHLSILERDPPLLLSWRFFPFLFPMKGYLGVFPDPMWGPGIGMSMCTDCKALWYKFVICENGLYK